MFQFTRRWRPRPIKLCVFHRCLILLVLLLLDLFFVVYVHFFTCFAVFFFLTTSAAWAGNTVTSQTFCYFKIFSKSSSARLVAGLIFLSFEVEWFGQLVGQLILILLYVLKRVILLWLNGRELLLLLLLLLLQVQREQNLFMNLNDLFIYKTPKVPA